MRRSIDATRTSEVTRGSLSTFSLKRFKTSRRSRHKRPPDRRPRSLRSAARRNLRPSVTRVSSSQTSCLLVVDVLGRDAGRAGDGLAVLRALLLVGGDARPLGGDERGGVLLHLHHRAGVVEGLLVLAGRRVGAVLNSQAVRQRGGREQEQRGGGAGSLGGDGTTERDSFRVDSISGTFSVSVASARRRFRTRKTVVRATDALGDDA